MNFRIEVYLIFQFWILMSIAHKSNQIRDCGFPGISDRSILTIKNASEILGQWNYDIAMEDIPVMKSVYKERTVATYKCEKPEQFILRGSNERICLWNGQWENLVPSCEENVAYKMTAKVPGINNTRWLTDGQMDPDEFVSDPIKNIELNVKYPIETVLIHFQNLKKEDVSGYKLTVENDKGCSMKEYTNHMIEYDCRNASSSSTSLKFSTLSDQMNPTIVEIQVLANSTKSLEETKKCRIPHIPANGEMSIHPSDSSPEIAIYKCFPGFLLVGPERRNCTGDNWTEYSPSCLPDRRLSTKDAPEPEQTTIHKPIILTTLLRTTRKERNIVTNNPNNFAFTNATPTEPPDNDVLNWELMIYILLSLTIILIITLLTLLWKFRNRLCGNFQRLPQTEDNVYLQPNSVISSDGNIYAVPFQKSY